MPTDTTVRFLLLIAAVVTASQYLFQALWFVARGERFLEAIERCGGLDPVSPAVAIANDELQRQAECRSGVSREQAVFALLGVGLVLLVAWLLYRARPWWRERRSHLVPIDPADGQALLTAVAEVAEEAGATAPTVRVDAVNPGVQAFVYGAGDRQRLGITGGLAVQQVIDPPGFRAVLRHEIAHVANRDVRWTYFTASTWWAFVLVALAPVVVVFVVSDLEYVLRLGWRTVALAVLVAVVGAGLLRAREVYADARAAEWGSGPDLVRLFGAEPVPTRAPRWWQRRPRWLRLHPSAQQRRDLLVRPDGLFTADWLTAFATGMTGGLAFASLRALGSLVLPQSWVLPLAALTVAPLVCTVVCVTAWRVGLRESVTGEHRPLGLPVGIGLGGGLALAPALSIESAIAGVAQDRAGWLGYAVWSPLMVVVTALVVRWVVDSGRVWVGGSDRRSTRLVELHIAMASVVLAVLLAASAQALLILSTAGPDALGWPYIWPRIPSVATGLWLGLAPVLAAALLTVPPLLARRARRARAEDVPRWRQPVVIAVVTAASAGLWLVLTRLLSAVVDDAVRASDAFAVGLGESLSATVVAAAVVASVVAAVVLPGRWWLLALVAGALASVLTSVVGLWATVLAGCGLLPSVSSICAAPGWALTRYAVLDPLTLAAAPAVLLVGMVGVWRAVRRDRRRTTSVLVAAATAAAVTALWAGGLAASALRTEPALLVGNGYTVAVPVGWTGQHDATARSSLFVTLAEDVIVIIEPVDVGAPPISGEDAFATAADLVPDTTTVGGETAALVGGVDEGGARTLAYDVDGPAGAYRVLLQGTIDSLTLRTAEVDALLSAVRWDP